MLLGMVPDGKIVKLFTPLPCCVTVEVLGVVCLCGQDSLQAFAIQEESIPYMDVLRGWWLFPICADCAKRRLMRKMRQNGKVT